MDIRANSQAVRPDAGLPLLSGNDIRTNTQLAKGAVSGADLVTISDKSQSKVSGLPVGSAPPLPQVTVDPDTANILVAGILDKVTTEDMKSLMKSLKDASTRLNTVNAEKLKKYSEKAAKAIEEAKKQREQKISGDVGFGLSMAGAVLGMVGAVLLTVFTLGGGAAAIAGASIGLASAILDGADRIAKDNKLMDSGINAGKQMDLTLGGLVSRAYQGIVASHPDFDKLSADQKEKLLNDLKMAAQIVTMIAVAGATIACGGISLSQISGGAAKAGTEAAKAGADAAKLAAQQAARVASQGAETIGLVTDITSGVNSIASGAYGVQIANITFEKNQIDNQKQLLDTFTELIKGEINATQDTLVQYTESLSNIYDTLANANKNFNESKGRLVAMS